jgi:hypothetical protein
MHGPWDLNSALASLGSKNRVRLVVCPILRLLSFACFLPVTCEVLGVATWASPEHTWTYCLLKCFSTLVQIGEILIVADGSQFGRRMAFSGGIWPLCTSLGHNRRPFRPQTFPAVRFQSAMVGRRKL